MDWITRITASIGIFLSLLFHQQAVKPHMSQKPIPPLTQNPSQPVPSQPTQSPSADTSYVYPGAVIQSQNGTTLVLQSADDPSTIMNWYRAKISTQNMHSVSSIQTMTNGTIDDVLDSSNGIKEVKVELKKQASVSQATITVTTGVSPSSDTPDGSI